MSVGDRRAGTVILLSGCGQITVVLPAPLLPVPERRPFLFDGGVGSVSGVHSGAGGVVEQSADGCHDRLEVGQGPAGQPGAAGKESVSGEQMAGQGEAEAAGGMAGSVQCVYGEPSDAQDMSALEVPVGPTVPQRLARWRSECVTLVEQVIGGGAGVEVTSGGEGGEFMRPDRLIVGVSEHGRAGRVRYLRQGQDMVEVGVGQDYRSDVEVADSVDDPVGFIAWVDEQRRPRTGWVQDPAVGGQRPDDDPSQHDAVYVVDEFAILARTWGVWSGFSRQRHGAGRGTRRGQRHRRLGSRRPRVLPSAR